MDSSSILLVFGCHLTHACSRILLLLFCHESQTVNFRHAIEGACTNEIGPDLRQAYPERLLGSHHRKAKPVPGTKMGHRSGARPREKRRGQDIRSAHRGARTRENPLEWRGNHASEFLMQLHLAICPQQPVPQEPQFLIRPSIHSKLSEKEQMHAGSLIDKDTEKQPSAQITLDNNRHLLSEELQTPGGYSHTANRKHETTAPEESMGSCMRRLAEVNDGMEDIEKMSVDIREDNRFKGLKDGHEFIMNGVTNTDRNAKEYAGSKNVENVAGNVREYNIHRVNSVHTENEIEDDEITKDTNCENESLADGEKEDTGAGVVVQGSEEMDTNTSEERRSRKRTRRNMNDNEITSEEADTNTGEDRQTRKRVRRFMNGKQIGIDTNRIEVRRTRKKPWRIMNDRQVAIIEEALRADPDMQRNRDALESWTEELKKIGPEFKIRQLRKW
eukprot:Gb_38593 [translate_table: standard]